MNMRINAPHLPCLLLSAEWRRRWGLLDWNFVVDLFVLNLERLSYYFQYLVSTNLLTLKLMSSAGRDGLPAVYML